MRFLIELFPQKISIQYSPFCNVYESMTCETRINDNKWNTNEQLIFSRDVILYFLFFELHKSKLQLELNIKIQFWSHSQGPGWNMYMFLIEFTFSYYQSKATKCQIISKYGTNMYAFTWNDRTDWEYAAWWNSQSRIYI